MEGKKLVWGVAGGIVVGYYAVKVADFAMGLVISTVTQAMAAKKLAP